MRRAARTDQNQQEIIDALRLCGASVHSLHALGEGCPDLLVGFRGTNYLLEVKTATGKLKRSQVEWLAGWRGRAAVVRSAVEALRAIGAIDAPPQPPRAA